MTIYEKFCALPIRHESLGFELPTDDTPYFCTPKHAEILGWGGVDGIHYCKVDGFGEMIFAVMPMNPPGDYIRPIARSFMDLLKLLLACGNMAAIDQAYFMDRNTFQEFVKDNPPDQAAQTALHLISDEFCLVPMDEPFSYIKTLQEEFEDNTIEFTEDYAAAADDCSQADESWIVEFDGSFFGGHKRTRVEPDVIPLEKHFLWCGKDFYIPNLYLFEEGIVLDIIAAVEAYDYKAFLDDHLEALKNGQQVTEEQQELIATENPLKNDYEAHLTLNGKPMRWCRGSGVCHVAPSCRSEWFGTEDTGTSVIRHYGLREDSCYAIRRISFPWPDGKVPEEIETLSIRLMHEPMMYPSIHLNDPKAGEQYTVIHPFTEEAYTLSITEVKSETVSESIFANEEMEFPTHYTAMRYTVEPPIDRNALRITDCCGGDSPRKKLPADPMAPKSIDSAAIGIIGGADGPTCILVGRTQDTAISSLRFEERPIEWRLRFYIKLHTDESFHLI